MILYFVHAWIRHDIETLSSLLGVVKGVHRTPWIPLTSVTSLEWLSGRVVKRHDWLFVGRMMDSLHELPAMWSFDVLFVVHLNKLLTIIRVAGDVRRQDAHVTSQ